MTNQRKIQGAFLMQASGAANNLRISDDLTYFLKTEPLIGSEFFSVRLDQT
jgi:hypothetical protein